MLSPELLQKIQNIFIRSHHRVNDIFAGEYESAFRGQGIEFEEFREYVPGDDVRQIDWNVTARQDKPFIKLFREEREQTIFFLVDSSRSLQFGRDKNKLEVATEVAALLAYAAIKNNDKTGLIIFSDVIEKYIPPKKGRGHVWNIIASLLTHKPRGVKTSINNAVQYLLRVTHRPSICFLISDFYDDSYHDSLRVAGMRHEFVAIRILDPLENKMPSGALMDFEDLETGARRGIDLKGQQSVVLDHQNKKKEELKLYFGTNKIDFLELTSDTDYVDVLLKYFIKREKRR
ncbi:MAG: DUF58 domain-containing protein [Deltaproteobacteria bacterium]|nr:DUF58 domain-containing protein [Deltaproteobacteria bacterium]